jgi:heat shock protein HslJ
MKSMMLWRAIALVVGVAFGCTPAAEEPPQPAQTARATITGCDWELVQLGDMMGPLGAGGRPITLRLDSTTSRAVGFAGCNQYGGPYALHGDSLTFGPPISTKMACAEGMEVETRYLGSLPTTRTYLATDSTLTLMGSDGALARFRGGDAEP